MILPADSVPLDQYDIQDLLTLKTRIEKRLPSIDEIDLQRELVFQFSSAKQLIAETQDDDDTPLNQKAQIINSAAALLKQLAEAQIKLYSAERNRAMEQALIAILAEADEEDREAFMEEYAKRLEAL